MNKKTVDFLPFDWTVFAFTQESSSPHVISTRTVIPTADSYRTTQMITTLQETEVQPQQITQAQVETTLMEVSWNCVVYSQCVFPVQFKTSLTYFLLFLIVP